MSERRWNIQPEAPAEAHETFPHLHPAAVRLLWNRGVRTREEAEVFFEPQWDRDTHDPAIFSNMSQAVARVFQAFAAGEQITVHGDYDADGVCGSTVLVTTLRDIGRQLPSSSLISSYIPHREKEGYGMSVSTMERLAEQGAKLVITVDCGISNKPAIDRGKELGVDTIVCDHHAMPEALPEQAIILHPQVPGEPYPNKHLCGTGVAFKLASSLIREARARGVQWPEGYEKWLLDLVAVATVTDVMPLHGENRVLEAYGLKVLNKTRRPGLLKLLEVAGSAPGALDTVSIGFQIGPRLNAAGRMEHADVALRLLTEEDPLVAFEKAQALQALNVERQKASDVMYKEAKAMIGDPGNKKVLVVWKEGWSAGLVGLVAGKLVNDLSRPVYVIGQESEHFVGSGRTAGGFDVTQALHKASSHLDRFGGHPQACGFSLTGEAALQGFIQAVEAYAEETLTPEDLIPTLSIDAVVGVEDLGWPLYEAIAAFEPFGEGNRKPILAAERVEVLYVDTMGAEGKHIRLTARGSRGTIGKFVGFRMSEWVPKLAPGTKVDLAFELGLNEWKGKTTVDMKLVDIRL